MISLLSKLKAENIPPPAKRFCFAIFDTPAVPISLFCVGSTTDPDISYWSPLTASVFLVMGYYASSSVAISIFIDSYEIHAASALAGLALIRYAAAGAMVEVDPVSSPSP